MEEKKIELVLIMEMLGTVPKNKQIYSDFIVDKAIKKGIDVDDAEELETVQELDEKGFTGFHVDEGKLFLYDYVVKGNIKGNLETLIQSGTIKKIPSYKKAVDNMLFIFPRKLYFSTGSGSPITEPHGILERPLRAMTMLGPRVTLTKSEYVDIGTKIVFEVKILPNPKITWEVVEKALDYGQYVGLGQWRGSGGYGRYAWRYV